MSSVLNRITGELILNAHVPDYIPDLNNNNTPWILDPDLSNVIGIEEKYWVIGENNSTTVRQMTPMEMDTNPAFVAAAQQAQIAIINLSCAAGITGGVRSDALGYVMVYDTTPDDQINMIGALLATSPNPRQPTGGALPYACRDPITNAKEFIIHTYLQLIEVFSDGAMAKLQMLTRANDFKKMIMAGTSVTQINAIKWT